MNKDALPLDPFVPYPPIEAHGVIGDRRTAALVAADGTIDWHCVPDYDGEPLFASLLDLNRGGFWRMGPAAPVSGKQKYLEGTAVLLTRWETSRCVLELCDAMVNPGDERQQEEARSIVRTLRCLSGHAAVKFLLAPRLNFRCALAAGRHNGNFLSLRSDRLNFGFWSSFPVETRDGSLAADLEIVEGQALSNIFGVNQGPLAGGVSTLGKILEETVAYWKQWSQDLAVSQTERKQIERSAITVHLLTFAPAGSAVAAVTTSLPERAGGARNWDYRFAWVRDTSLSLALLALLGKGGQVGKYLDWLSRRESLTDAPLQVMYHPDGGTGADPIEVGDVDGYRESRPVRLGNPVFRQRQHGAVGYLVDCTLIYLDNGGRWRPEYWELIRRVAEHTASIWKEPDNGIWEMDVPVHWVASKVMSCVP